MKNIVLCICIFAVSFSSNAQSKNEQEVNAVIKEFNKALVDADKNKLEELTADDMTYGHSSGKVEEKADFIKNALTGPIDFQSIDISDNTIRFAGNDAIVRHVLSAKVTTNGVAGDLKLGVLIIWQKRKGQWKIVARQACKL